MNSALLRWLQLSMWLRMLTLALVTVVLAIAVWQLWQPSWQHRLSLQAQKQQQSKRYQATLRSLGHRQSLYERETEIGVLQQALRPEPQRAFSLSELTAGAGNALKIWQPTSGGGELTLELDWLHLQGLLRYLSERQPAVTLPQFTLKRVHDRLQFQCMLRADRER